MAFQINTNINALNAHAQGTFTSRNLANSLEKLSSGLRINKAADDASGLAIADTLRTQANSLGQAIRNTNDGIGIIQIADKAMDEQVKILDTIKVKATQAAQDGQTTASRKALQADITRLIEGLDNIAATTSYNGQSLLAGSFTNKEFQVGAYSNQTIRASIGPTSSDKIGQVRIETAGEVKASEGKKALQNVSLTFGSVDGTKNTTLESVAISTSAGTGIGVLAEVINKNADQLNVRASWSVQATGGTAVASGTVKGLVINNITIGTVNDIQKNDGDGRLIAAINAVKDQTGVEASIDTQGRLNLTSIDGRAIDVKAVSAAKQLGNGSFAKVSDAAGSVTIGRLTLTRLDARDINISGVGFGQIGLAASGNTSMKIAKIAESTVNLRQVRGSWSADVASAAGANANASIASGNAKGIGAGVTTLQGAMVVMDIAESAIKMLDRVRSDLGSVQNQMTSTVNNITITQVNVQAAESNIREVDFAMESSTYSKLNILAQAGSYAMSQANSSQQNILRLLQ